jgi:hypothetical protein
MLRMTELSAGERAAMGGRARAYVEQEHSFATLAQRLALLLNEVTAAAPVADAAGDATTRL